MKCERCQTGKKAIVRLTLEFLPNSDGIVEDKETVMICFDCMQQINVIIEASRNVQ